MAFYQDRKKGTKAQKRLDAKRRSGFEDEGSRYRGEGPSPVKRSGYDRPQESRGGAPSGGRKFAGERPIGGRPAGDKPFRGHPARPRPTANATGRGFSPAPGAQRFHKPSEAYRYDPRPTYGVPPPARPTRAAPAAPAVHQEADLIPPDTLLSGRNPIREALRSGRDIEKLLVAQGELSGSAREIVQTAKDRHIPVQVVNRARLDAITPHHQGLLAFASAYQYRTLDDMLSLAQERGEAPLLVLLDGITDPHNLGAIIRSAECAGAHGVIVQERRAVGLTPAAVKASAGAVEYLPVARVTNLTQTVSQLQKLGIWVYAAHMEGEDYTAVDMSGPLALVIGAEGEGVSRLVLENCDRRISLPVRGKLDSLNASVAAGVLLYAAMRAR